MDTLSLTLATHPPSSPSAPSQSLARAPAYSLDSPLQAYEPPLSVLLVRFIHTRLQGKELDDPVVVNAVAGSMAGTFTAVFVCPLDVLKTRLQVQASHHQHYRSITGAPPLFASPSPDWRRFCFIT